MSKTPRARTPRPARGHVQTAAAVLRGLLSLTVLLALLGGLPMLLWWATSVVGPPGMAALGSLFSTDDSGQVFLLALAVAGWIGWALFACAVLLEIPAQLRGRAAPQIRGLVGQRAAATLISAVLLALPTGTALALPASAAPATAATTGVSAAAVPGTATTNSPAGPAASSSDTGHGQVTYTVRDTRPAESLWSIAETTLGDGQRWEEIAALNEGRTMPAGLVFHAERPIQPGWTLQLPTDARPGPDGQASPSAPHNSGTSATTYTVREGDSLSTIADQQLGDPDRYGEIFDLNKDSDLPGGGAFTDPNLIHPGQHLTLPQPATTTPAPPAEAKPDPGRKPAPATPDATTSPTSAAPSPGASATPTPTASAPTAGPSATPAPAPAATGQSPQPAPPTTASPVEGATSGQVNVAMIAGIGTLLAASLAGALGVRRILQQRERRAGQTIAQDEEPTPLEQILAAGSEPAGIELLDGALRTLAHHAADRDLTLPALRGARLDAAGVTLLLDEPAAPITPFADGPAPRVWILDEQAELLAAEDLTDVQAPYPGLVTLGANTDGLVLIDLMTCRILLLDGSDEEILEVARALALELGTCAWTDYSEILTCGLGARLAGLLPQGRIRTMPHLPAVAADLGELMLEAHQSGEQVLPWLAVLAGETDDEHVVQLADALAAGRTLDTAVVLPATAAARRCFPHAEVLTVTDDEDTAVAVLETSVDLQRITDEQYRQYIHALTVSTQDAKAATGPWEKAEDHSRAAAGGATLTVHAVGEGSLDPGNPFPALLAKSIPAPATPTAGNTGATAPATANTTGAGTPDTHSSTKAEAPAAAEQPPKVPAAAVPAPHASPLPQPPGPEDTSVRIDVLGPLRISGGAATAHSPRTTSVAAYIHLRPGRSADALCAAMDFAHPWSTRTLHSRLSELRNAIGLHTNGQPLLPRPKTGAGYAFHPAVTSDWAQFQEYAGRGLAAGPPAGIEDLEAAMALVRGKPFDGRTLPWADPIIQDMLSRITDTAHTLARWHADGPLPDLDAARRTVHKGLDIEETSEVLYRDLLTIERAAGNDAAIRRTIARIQHMARTYDLTLEDTTQDTITHALTGNAAPAAPFTVRA
ncbi:LysM peptidoglycan-binding domain-containing protein [Streptomyces sp. NPDC048269]|uniref:LysM peptidoglycan-binding domain-containing protein n=1 Tax=Streptomyces sp. NPDC048269 TaxID=3155753 RepID=UPI00341F5A54